MITIIDTNYNSQGGTGAPFLQLRPAEKTFLAMSGVLSNVRNAGPRQPCDNLAQVSFQIVAQFWQTKPSF